MIGHYADYMINEHRGTYPSPWSQDRGLYAPRYQRRTHAGWASTVPLPAVPPDNTPDIIPTKVARVNKSRHISSFAPAVFRIIVPLHVIRDGIPQLVMLLFSYIETLFFFVFVACFVTTGCCRFQENELRWEHHQTLGRRSVVKPMISGTTY